MRRPISFRFASALLAVWFMVLVVHPEWMHSMTMGGMQGMQGMPAMPDVPVGHVAAHSGMAGMDGHDSSPTKQDDSNGCARHDCCCVTVLVSVPRGAELDWVPARILRAEAVAPPRRLASSLGEHVIPFAIGPPDALAG